jgi:hypothetical protein
VLVSETLEHRAVWEWFAASGVAALALLFGMLRAWAKRDAAWRRVALYVTAQARMSGEHPNSGKTGEDFAREGHLFQQDLNVLGVDSIFDRLATTRTTLGQRGLACLLLDPATTALARERQDAVRELAEATDLRERVALLGRSKFEDVPAESLEEWLDGERHAYPRWLQGALLAVTLAWMAMGVGGLAVHFDSHLLLRNLEVLVALQALLCLRVRRAVNRELESAKKLFGQMAILREGLRLLREQRFACALLRGLQEKAQGEDRALAQLERWLAIVEQRPKEWFYIFSLGTCMGTHAAISLQRWRVRYDEPMRRWLAVWAEFEALVAMGTYAAEHERDAWPELVDAGEACFEAEGLRHPLLARESAVANAVVLGVEAKFLLISGSNMAGKSTLLRAVGANAVLAFAGAPVAATSLRCGIDRIGASLAVADSLSEGKSKFLAEVERLRALVELARAHKGRTLFLIDEILSGTNSLDRKTAAEMVLRALIAAGAIGAISTHDLTLTEIAEAQGMQGRNVHMASPDEEDPLGFDYKLKDGSNKSTNAMAIVRMMGLGS